MTHHNSLRALILGLFAAALLPSAPYDILIRNGTVVDGSGSPGFSADVAIDSGRIVAIGNLADATADRTIDAKGLVVSPGFIDMHNHSDNTLLDEPRCESMIRQGVTTMVLGEGGSAGPTRDTRDQWTTLGEYFDYAEKKGFAANI
jgi:N-acyl-D-aspartate/D-glutamate deacylase